MAKLQQSKTGAIFIVIPKELVMVKGWKKGDIILVSLEKDAIVLRKAEIMQS